MAHGQDVNAVWLEAWGALERSSNPRPNEYKGASREVLHFTLCIEDARARWLTARLPTINPAFAIAEVIWIITGRNDLTFLTPWNSQLAKYSGASERLPGAYGERLRSRFGFDQLNQLSCALEANPDSRQGVLCIWDPSTDLPNPDGTPTSGDIPCNVLSLVRVNHGVLTWLQVMRSNDLIRGLPYNVVQWTIMAEVVAGWLKLELGAYHHLSDSLHVYDRDIPDFHPTPSPYPPGERTDLRLPKRQSEDTWQNLAVFVDKLTGTNSPDIVLSLLSRSEFPAGYTDLASVLAMERLRRLGKPELARGIDVADAGLSEAVKRWFNERRR